MADDPGVWNIPNWRDPRVMFTGIALLFLLAHLAGLVAFDTPALGILVLAALPWLGLFLTSIKAFGVEAELHDLRDKVEEVENRAEDTAQRLDLETDLASRSAAAEVSSRATGQGTDALYAVAREYVDARAATPSGSERTAEMTRLFHRMMELSRGLGDAADEIVAGLSSDDPGRVLAAVAYAYEKPGSASVRQLLDAISATTQPFIQYWGLMAIRKLTKIKGIAAWSAGDVADFRALRGGFRNGTDRAWVHDQIAAMLDGFA